MEELSYVFTQYFISCVHVRVYFSAPLIFTFLAASISHFLTAALTFLFFSLRNSSPLFSITRSSSFSVIHVSVNIKNNAEKDTTLLFFLSKSRGGHVISFQLKRWVAFGLPYLLIESFCIVMPVVRTDGRYHISLAMGLRRGVPWSSAKTRIFIPSLHLCLSLALCFSVSYQV